MSCIVRATSLTSLPLNGHSTPSYRIGDPMNTSPKRMNYMPPAWHQFAPCAQKDRDPRDYDADTLTGSRITKILTAARRCAMCPLTQRCAQEAIDRQACGVIRAGVVLSGSVWKTAPASSVQALHLIADGARVPDALIDATAGIDAFRPLHGPLGRLAARVRRHHTHTPIGPPQAPQGRAGGTR